MLKLNRNECFDLNKLGLLFIVVVFIYVMFYPTSIFIILGAEILLILVSILLFKKVRMNKNAHVLANTEKQWFVEVQEQTFSVQLKDYWVFPGLLFFWLKGEKYSVSFVVTRSIIGAQKFSQLRTKIL